MNNKDKVIGGMRGKKDRREGTDVIKRNKGKEAT
jgi:hypothetical protein